MRLWKKKTLPTRKDLITNFPISQIRDQAKVKRLAGGRRGCVTSCRGRGGLQCLHPGVTGWAWSGGSALTWRPWSSVWTGPGGRRPCSASGGWRTSGPGLWRTSPWSTSAPGWPRGPGAACVRERTRWPHRGERERFPSHCKQVSSQSMLCNVIVLMAWKWWNCMKFITSQFSENLHPTIVILLKWQPWR